MYPLAYKLFKSMQSNAWFCKNKKKALEKKKSLRKYTNETFISYDRQNNAQLCQHKQNMQQQKKYTSQKFDINIKSYEKMKWKIMQSKEYRYLISIQKYENTQSMEA